MNRRMMINDLMTNKLVSAATCLFMALTAMLLGLSILLFASLADSIDSLMTEAKTPDFLQMHTGDPDEASLNAFARQRDDIEAMQICTFLNLQNSQLTLGNTSLESNMQDNGLCRQSESFDYLVDSECNAIYPADGEVYVPVCYRKEYGIHSGDVMKIGTEELIIVGFLRDSQMNSMMASSKRFLVSDNEYQKFLPAGSEEYLIEFRLKEGSDVNAFATAYKDAALPDNGPTITYPLIRMMNALSDGMMILVILMDLYSFFQIRHGKMDLNHSLLWITVSLILLIIAAFPGIAVKLAALIGIELPINLMFLAFSLFSLVLSIYLTMLISKEGKTNRRLVQQIALLEQRVRELEGSEKEQES